MITAYFDIPSIRPDFEPGTEPRRIVHVPPQAIPPAETQLWRFMDFPKLVSLLERKALFFPRANELEDQFEGTWSRATLQRLEGSAELDVIECDNHVALYSKTDKYGLVLMRPYSPIEDPSEKELFDRIASQGPSDEVMYSSYGYGIGTIVHHVPTGHRFLVLGGGTTIIQMAGVVGHRLHGRDGTIEAARSFVSFWKSLLPHTMVNSWHESEYESEAMWKLYARDKYGIAIKTNMKSLANCFVKRYPDAIGRVQYISYDQELIPVGLASPLLFKRRNFDHEREVRAIMTDFLEDLDGDGTVKLPKTIGNEGRYFEVDPKQLIQEIVISPLAVHWLHELTQSVTRKYRLDVPVVKSILTEEPTW